MHPVYFKTSGVGSDVVYPLRTAIDVRAETSCGLISQIPSKYIVWNLQLRQSEVPCQVRQLTFQAIAHWLAVCQLVHRCPFGVGLVEIDRPCGLTQIDIKHSMLETQRILFSTGRRQEYILGRLEAARERALRFHALRKSQARMGVEFSLVKVFSRHTPKKTLVERARATPHTNMCIQWPVCINKSKFVCNIYTYIIPMSI